MGDEKKGLPFGKLLVVLLLLLVSAGVVACYVPLAECPACEGTGIVKGTAGKVKLGPVTTRGLDCLTCEKTGKITLYTKYRFVPLDPSLLPNNPLK